MAEGDSNFETLKEVVRKDSSTRWDIELVVQPIIPDGTGVVIFQLSEGFLSIFQDGTWLWEKDLM